MFVSLLVGAPLLVLALGVVVWIVTGAALRPVERMAEEAEAISMSEPGRRLPEPIGDHELARLGRTLNAMLERIEAAFARERAFVDDASHELRTPLAILRGELELTAGDADDPEAVRLAMASSLEEVERLGRMTEDLLTLSRECRRARRAPRSYRSARGCDRGGAARSSTARGRLDRDPR